MRDSFSASVHTESVCFLLSLVRNRESHCLLPENPPPAQGSLWGGRGSFLQPCPAAPSSLSSMPVVPSLCSSWASLGPALSQHCLRQGAPSARPAPCSGLLLMLPWTFLGAASSWRPSTGLQPLASNWGTARPPLELAEALGDWPHVITTSVPRAHPGPHRLEPQRGKGLHLPLGLMLERRTHAQLVQP